MEKMINLLNTNIASAIVGGLSVVLFLWIWRKLEAEKIVINYFKFLKRWWLNLKVYIQKICRKYRGNLILEEQFLLYKKIENGEKLSWLENRNFKLNESKYDEDIEQIVFNNYINKTLKEQYGKGKIDLSDIPLPKRNELPHI